jgi:predicted MFS family arabinose efflux permease
MGILMRFVFGLAWLALCYWLADKRAGRILLSLVTAVLLLVVVCALFADQYLDPWLKETHRLPRGSLKAQLQASGTGALVGLVLTPLLVKFDAAYWVFQVAFVLVWVILPSLSLHNAY